MKKKMTKKEKLLMESFLKTLKKLMKEDTTTISKTTNLSNINAQVRMSDIAISDDGSKISISINNIPQEKIIPLPSNVTSLFVAIDKEDDLDKKQQLIKLKDETFDSIKRNIFNILSSNLRNADIKIGNDIRNLLANINGV